MNFMKIYSDQESLTSNKVTRTFSQGNYHRHHMKTLIYMKLVSLGRFAAVLLCIFLENVYFLVKAHGVLTLWACRQFYITTAQVTTGDYEAAKLTNKSEASK